MNALVRVLTAIVALAVLAPAAQATLPGRNGEIGFVFSGAGGDTEPFVETIGLEAKVPGRQRKRSLVECERTDGAPSGGDCRATKFSSPSYSPDGSRIVFDAGERIGLIGAGGAGLALLPSVSGDDGDPAFSPDGRRIVFTGANDRGTTDLYVHRLGSLFARQIVNDASEPAWSSRNEIAYVRDGNVYVSNWKGNRRRFVVSGRSPDWSPGGGRLVFVRPLPNLTFEGAVGRVFTVGARGRGLQRVFPRVTDAFGPVWSPDSRWLAFARAEAGVFAKRLGSRRPAELIAETQISGESGSVAYFDPAWRPRPRR